MFMQKICPQLNQLTMIGNRVTVNNDSNGVTLQKEDDETRVVYFSPEKYKYQKNTKSRHRLRIKKISL